MENFLKDGRINLHLFDGGAAGGAGAGAAGAAAGSGEGGATPAAAGSDGNPGNGRPGKTGAKQEILYGKQPGDSAPAAEEHDDGKEREARFREMITGECKDLYDAEVQRIINKRFAKSKGDKEQLSAQEPVMALLRERYGTDDVGQLAEHLKGDRAIWESQAEQAGFDDIDQYIAYRDTKIENNRLMEAERQRRGLEAARQQMDAWNEEAAAVREDFPEFDLEAEAENPEFVRLLRNHVPMDHAYKLLHMDEIMQRQAAETERHVVDNIRSRGTRPAEAGASAQTAVTVKRDVTKLTREDRRNIANQVRRGKTDITF